MVIGGAAQMGMTPAVLNWLVLCCSFVNVETFRKINQLLMYFFLKNAVKRGYKRETYACLRNWQWKLMSHKRWKCVSW